MIDGDKEPSTLRVRISAASIDHVDRAPYEQALIWFPSAYAEPLQRSAYNHHISNDVRVENRFPC